MPWYAKGIGGCWNCRATCEWLPKLPTAQQPCRSGATRGAGAQFGWNPAPWFTRLTIEINAGDRVDVEADRLGRGADGFIEAIVRGQIGGFGVESEQKLQAGFIDRGGQRVLTDPVWGPRASPSTTTSSIQALSPVGMR